MARGQVWVETVIYTLIGLSLLALVLAFVMPKLNEYRDRSVIEQTIDSLNQVDSKLQEVVDAGPGNVRRINFQLKRGELTLNATNESIRFFLEDSEAIYSEPGVPTSIGRISVLSSEGATKNTVSLALYYNMNIALVGDPVQTFPASATPYEFSIFFNSTSNGRPVLIINELSGR